MDWKKRLNYDGSKEAKLSIVLDVLVIVSFVIWGMYVMDAHFARGLNDGYREIQCLKTNAEYQNMAWNGTTTYGQLNENWSRAWNFEKNITEILEYLKGKNITSK
jgi:hypothetical protein